MLIYTYPLSVVALANTCPVMSSLVTRFLPPIDAVLVWIHADLCSVADRCLRYVTNRRHANL